LPVNELQRADVVRMQNIQKNYGGCVPETVTPASLEVKAHTNGDEQVKARTMKQREFAKRLSKNPTQELPSNNDLFRGSQYGVCSPDDEGDTSGRQEPLLTQKKKPFSFKKVAEAMSQGLGRSASHNSVHGSTSNTNSPRQALRKSISSWILEQLRNKEGSGETRRINKARDIEEQ